MEDISRWAAPTPFAGSEVDPLWPTSTDVTLFCSVTERLMALEHASILRLWPWLLFSSWAARSR